MLRGSCSILRSQVCAPTCGVVGYSRLSAATTLVSPRSLPRVLFSRAFFNERPSTQRQRNLSFVAGRSRTMTTAASVAASTDVLQVEHVNCLKDNYVWILKDKSSGKVAVVDPSEAKPVAAALDKWGYKPDYVLNTHHHHDHTGGNKELKERYGLTIVGPKADKDRIPGIDIALGDGDSWQFGDLEMRVFDTPGHTRGHITLYFPQAHSLFPGDTLFSMGCGRLFEGTPNQMWRSLSKMTVLPPETAVYCAHEYTQSNAKFALSIDPDNKDLQARAGQVNDLRSKGLPTIPSTLGEELAVNPFLRPNDPAIRRNLNIPEAANEVDAFATIRQAKDNF